MIDRGEDLLTKVESGKAQGQLLRAFYIGLGLLSLGFAGLGAFIPLLPTVPFLLLSAFLFSRGSRRLETWMLEHRQLGPPIRAWRASGSISRAAKRKAYAAFGLSAAVAAGMLPLPWLLIPLAAAVTGCFWIWARPEPRS